MTEPGLLARTCVVVVALVMAWAMPAAARQSVAERQLEIAQAQLGEGRNLEALGNAESALRADPELGEATFVKALAYEGLGRPRVAELLVLAWRDARGAGSPVDVEETLARLRRSEDAGGPIGPEQVAGFLPAQDPAPYAARIRVAVGAGRCSFAAAAAAELTLWRPDVQVHWQLQGSAAQCSGDYRGAVLALTASVRRPRPPR